MRKFMAFALAAIVAVVVFSSTSAARTTLQPYHPFQSTPPVSMSFTLPNPQLPNIMCLYYHALDRVQQDWVTQGNAIHLDPSNESHTGRWIDPGDLLVFKDNDPMNHCDILIDMDEVNAPMTLAQMEEYHINHLQYELTHTPRPLSVP